MSFDPIAITGIGCRYPGGITSPQTFWDFVLHGGDAVERIPKERNALWSVWGNVPDYPEYGGFVDQIDAFDAAFFQISPREAKHIDPQQRLLLELAWEALEDAGLPPSTLAGRPVGVFIGIFLAEYWDLQRYTDPRHINGHTNTGGTMSIAANRISYTFDFKGPSLSVDTACSSSLTAIHLACQSLYQQECNLALAGGVNLILTPQTTRGFNQAQMLSPDGLCRAFDARANGYGRSDGAGLVVLKPLDRAIEDGDPIYAVIHGSAINQDGSTRGMTQPDPDAQKAVIQRAAQQAGITPAQLTYVEAHGTGTPTGDPIEAMAIGQATGATEPCLIGSVKTNIGHTEAAAGVAGLIKTALLLKHRVIPPSLHWHQPNPDIAFDTLNLQVVTEPMPLTGQIYAGVNSFGFGGANAHVILGSPPDTTSITPSMPPPYLLTISAEQQDALNLRIQQMGNWVGSHKSGDLYPLAATLGARRHHHTARAALVCSDHSTASQILNDLHTIHFSERAIIGSSPLSPAPIVLVLTGMGPQWWGMGHTLYLTEPVFRKAVDQGDTIFHRLAGWSIRDEMLKGEADSRMSEPAVSQPANLILQWGLYQLWTSWGIAPDMVVGHSVGEIAAACISGAISLHEAIRIIYHRSRLQQQSSGAGAMLAVGMARQEAEAILYQYGDRISLAAVNSPLSVTFSGETEAIRHLEHQIQAMGLYCKRLHVDVAYHSHQMETHKDPFLDALSDLTLQPHRIPMVSTVKGAPVDGLELTPEYWWDNIRAPILFDAACAHLPDAHNLLLIQLGPHPVLSLAISENLAHQGRAGWPLASLQRGQGDKETLLTSLAHCYIHGRAIRWDQLYSEPYKPVQLPAYPWQRERFWLAPAPHPSPGSFTQNRGHLGNRIKSSIHADTYIWETQIDLEHDPYLQDHRIQNKPLFPMAGLIDLLLETWTDSNHRVAWRTLQILQPLYFSEAHPYTLQVAVAAEAMTISSRQSTEQDEDHPWQILATARSLSAGNEVQYQTAEELPDQYSETVDGPSFYAAITQRGYTYGPQFRRIKHLSHSTTASIAYIEGEALEGFSNSIHPCLIDAAIQAFIPLLPEHALCLPVSVDTILFHRARSGETSFRAHARLLEDTDQGLHIGNLLLSNSEGQPLLELRGIGFTTVERKQKPEAGDISRLWLFQEHWHQIESLDQTLYLEGTHWLIFDNAQGSGELLKKAFTSAQVPCDLIAEASEGVLRAVDNFGALIHECIKATPDQSIGVVFFASISELGRSDLPVSYPAAEVLHLLQGILKHEVQEVRLWLVTSGGQDMDTTDQPNLSPASIAGLGRVIAREHPELACTLIDLPSDPDDSVTQDMLPILNSAAVAQEYGIRNHQIYCRRLLPVDDSSFEACTMSSAGFEHSDYQLTAVPPGSLDDLHFQHAGGFAPLAADEVRLRVLATGLNFRDVMTALGLLPIMVEANSAPLGWECAGEVIATGDQAKAVQAGDLVAAIAPGSFSRFVVTKATLVAAKPAHLSVEETASLPIAFITAYYGLVTLGRIAPCERVLIHAATGGVGLAAIQLARIYDAEIFATAGSPEKRRYLEDLGIPHIMDSRTTDFAADIIRETAGAGVDLILNSLSGDGMQRSLSVLAPYGRFIEIGKTDLLHHHMVDLHHFEQNISYHAVDLARLTRDHPEKVGDLLRRVIALTEEGKLHPIPSQVFPIQDVRAAYRTMAQARHIGKLVVASSDDPVMLRLKKDDPLVKPEATYLVTGGMGGIGQVLTDWLCEKGARHIVLLGRSDIKPDQLNTLTEYSKAGVHIRYMSVDVTDYNALQQVITSVQADGPPLRGIFHCAGVLDDGLLMNYDASRLEQVMSPKMTGAWHLHTLTLDLGMDLFVLFSSVASAVGTAGQGGYAAANAGLDALAAIRRAKGLPGISINWGPWAHTGMADEVHVADRLQRQGLHLIPPAEACILLDRLLHFNLHHICVMPLDGDVPRITKDHPLFMDLSSGPHGGSNLSNSIYSLSELQSLPTAQKRYQVDQCLREAVSQVVELDGAALDMGQSWRSLGVDSLMAVELRHRLESRLHVSIPVTDFQSSKLIRETMNQIIGQWGP